MGGITSSVGLVSGINTQQVIDQLIAIESRPKTQLQSRIDRNNSIRVAYTDLQTRLTSLRVNMQALKRSTNFRTGTATSSNSNILAATATSGVTPGTYQFQVARLVSAQQAVTGGFADTSSLVGAGTVTVELGGGELKTTTDLATLNGGSGVRRGVFRITDRSGASATVDISNAVTLEDVAKKINTALGVSVKAEIGKDGLKLSDLTGVTTTSIKVQDLSGGNAAADLGIAGTFAASTVTGATINRIGRSTALNTLNDGRGIRTATSTGQKDLTVQLRNGTSKSIEISGARTVGDLIDSFNDQAGGAARLEIGPNGRGFRVVDLTGGTGTLAVTNPLNSTAAFDLGLQFGVGTNNLDGYDVQATLGTVLTRSLNGGNGLELGAIVVNVGGAEEPVDLSSAVTVQDIIDKINATGIATASLKESGNGIQVRSNTGEPLTISSDDATDSAEALGIAGTAANGIAKGANLQRQYINENTLLSGYNGGKGVPRGKFRITDTTGKSAEVDLTQGNELTLRDVISEINTRGLKIKARINDRGDGLLIESTSGTSGVIRVEDTTGTAAAALQIVGSSSTGKIDGSFEKTITTTATDTVATFRDKLNALNFGASASIINDGSAANPTRLSLTARDAGKAARFIFDAGNTQLGSTNLVESQDAAVFLGTSSASQPVLLTSTRNQISNAIPGVTLDLVSASEAPVTVSVARNAKGAAEQVTKFVENFNSLIEKVKELTKFDPTTGERGLLLGDSAIRTVEQNLYSSLGKVVDGVGRFRTLSDVGVKQVRGGGLEFDESKFSSAYAEDPAAVEALFTTFEQVVTTTTQTGSNKNTTVVRTINGTQSEGTKTSTTAGVTTTVTVKNEARGFAQLLEAAINKLIDVTDGVIPTNNKTIDRVNSGLQSRIGQLDTLIENKRARLERQFAQMETTLSKLQNQGSAISNIQTISLSSNKK